LEKDTGLIDGDLTWLLRKADILKQHIIFLAKFGMLTNGALIKSRRVIYDVINLCKQIRKLDEFLYCSRRREICY